MTASTTERTELPMLSPTPITPHGPVSRGQTCAPRCPRHRRRARHRPHGGPRVRRRRRDGRHRSPAPATSWTRPSRHRGGRRRGRGSVADVTDQAAITAAVAELPAHLGPIDLLVNNAGIVGPDRAPVGRRRRRLVVDDGRQPPRPAPVLAARPPDDGRAGGEAASSTSRARPGRSLAAGVALLRVEGRGHEAHREPRA